MSGLHIASDGTWTLGFLIGLPFAALGALILFLVFAGSVILSIWPGTPSGSRTGPICSAVGSFFLLAAFVIGMMFAFYPWQGAYHQYREVDGTVTAVSSRLVAGDKSTNQKFVVTLAGSPQQFGIDDTRAALLKVGDPVTLSCIKSWQYGAQFGYDCNWGKP